MLFISEEKSMSEYKRVIRLYHNGAVLLVFKINIINNLSKREMTFYMGILEELQKALENTLLPKLKAEYDSLSIINKKKNKACTGELSLNKAKSTTSTVEYIFEINYLDKLLIKEKHIWKNGLLKKRIRANKKLNT